MFGLSKNKRKHDPNAIDADDILKSNTDESNTEEVETTLSIPEDWNVSSEERYVFAFHNSESPKLKVNQISIYGMELTELRDKRILVTGLIRNTVPKPIQFGNTTILLIGPDKEVLAKREFDLSQLGSIPANAARPWKFIFNKDNIKGEIELPHQEWSLVFELKSKHQLDLDESWEKSIAEETKANLQAIVEKAAPLKPGEVNFMGIQAKQNDQNDLVVTLLIRNGSDKNITLQQLPLGVKDATGTEIARGSFKLQDFTVKANTSKPWTFIFPSQMMTKEDIDLSRWQAYPIQN